MSEHKFNEDRVKPDPEQRERNLRLIQGGRPAPGGKEPPVKNWLTPLTPDTVFLGRLRRDPGFILVEYTVLRHFEHSTALWLEDMEVTIFVHVERFCRDIELIDIIREGTEEYDAE